MYTTCFEIGISPTQTLTTRKEEFNDISQDDPTEGDKVADSVPQAQILEERLIHDAEIPSQESHNTTVTPTLHNQNSSSSGDGVNGANIFPQPSRLLDLGDDLPSDMDDQVPLALQARLEKCYAEGFIECVREHVRALARSTKN